MIQSSSSGRVKLNRTVLRKNSNELPKKRRSFSRINVAGVVTETAPANLTLNAGVENTTVEEKTTVLELSTINIKDDKIYPTCIELNQVNASHPTSTKVELQQAPEEDKDTPNQAEGLSKGTAQPLDTNLPYELRRRRANPGQNTSAFGDITLRAGGPNTRSKSSSGKTSFKACELEKMKSQRVKRHRKQVCCRLEFALCIFGEDSDKIGVSKKEHSIQSRSKCKTENVFLGSVSNRNTRQEKRSNGRGKTRVERTEHTQTIRVTGVKAKKRKSKGLIFQRKRHSEVNNDIAYMNTTTGRHAACLVTDSSSKTLAVSKRRQTSVKKEKAEDRLCLAVRQQTKEGWRNGKIKQVRSSVHVVGTAKKDAKSSHCMTLRRRKSDAVTESWIYKVPAKKPNTEGSAAFQPNSHQICDQMSDHCDDNKRLIKSPCCTTCSELKYAPTRTYSLARVRSYKPCKNPAKIQSERGFKKRESGNGYNPFVNLCDVVKVSEAHPDSRYALNENLKRKTIRCFKRDYGNVMCLDVQDGPCSSAEARKSQKISNHYAAHIIGQSTKDMPSVVNGHFPIVSLAEIDDNQTHASETLPGKRMLLSTERISNTAHESDVFREPDTVIQMECSTTASTFHEKRPMSDTMLLCSPGPVYTSEHCKPRDGVLGNRSPVVSHMIPGESRADECVDEETEHENENPKFSSCQRTTPSQARARPSCARVYISWPFRERLCFTNGWDVSVTSLSVSEPSSRNSTSSVTRSVSLLSDRSFTPVSQNVSHSSEVTDSSPSFGDASDFQDGSEHLRASETNVSISEKCSVPESVCLVNGSGVPAQMTLMLQRSVPSAEAVELQHDPQSCSSPTGHPSKVVQEQGTCRKDQVEPQVCESDALCRQKLQQTKAPSKQFSNSVNQDKSPAFRSLSIPCRPMNGTMQSPLFSTSLKMCRTPSGLAQGEHLPCVSQVKNLRARTDVSSAPAEAGDGTGSMSSDDELIDEVLAPSGDIMCEIQDTGRSCQCSVPVEEAPSERTFDLLKAYEQDAIVLDVIQDDPELFGSLPEEHNVKNETPLVSQVIHPVKTNAVKNNHKINLDDDQLCTTGSDGPKQQDPAQKVSRSIPPVQTEGFSDGEVPILNDLAVEGFHTESSLPAQGTTYSTQSGVCEWLWPDFKTSVQGNARLNSDQASASTSDELWDVGLDDDPFQTNVINKPSTQKAAWTARSLNRLCAGSERYCRFHFSETLTCFKNMCFFLHAPVEGDEKFCMAAVKKLCRGQSSHLLRAAAVFTGYYQKCAPGIHFEKHTLKSLLSALLGQGIIKDLLSVLQVMTPYKILPPVQFILSVFEYVSVWGLRIAVPDLIHLIAKCVKAGLVFTTENFEYMQCRLELLQTPRSQMEVFLTLKYRVLETSVAWIPAAGDLAIALAEVECCKEQQDWAKLGAVFSSVCAHNTCLTELSHLSENVAMALLVDTPPNSPLAFCQFVEAVCQGTSMGGLVKSFLGRIGVSLMLRYYTTQQWIKGKKLLDALSTLKVNYSTVKGLFAGESNISRCRIINMAAEVFLSCGSMECALSVFKDNEWILSSSLWQCDEVDVAHRHSILCRLAECTTKRNMFVETLEILTHLPDIQDVKVDPAQYNIVFHLHLKACLEKQNLTVASDIADFMFSKNIKVDTSLLRLLLRKLGKQNSWQKARILYKSAASMGCYPQTQMKKYCRFLPIPDTLSEVEMTLALEMFMVSNASDIQNPGSFPHALQIVLKGKGGAEVNSKIDNHDAISRLLSAAQTANPKLVIKYATVSVSQEQVFTLDSLSAYKWLSQNLDWASQAWQPTDSNSENKTPGFVSSESSGKL